MATPTYSQLKEPSDNLKELIRAQNAAGVTKAELSGYEPFDVLVSKAAFNANEGSGGSVSAWGDLGGTLSAQTDLQSALDTKVDESGGILTNGTLAGTTTAAVINADSATVTSIVINSVVATNGIYRGFTLTGLNFGATVAQWEAVYLGAASTWLLADADGVGMMPARGLSVASGVNTGAATILTSGIVRNDAWNWTPGGDIYVSTTAGGLTQTAPAVSGNKVQPVGYAITADIAYFHFNQAHVTVA